MPASTVPFGLPYPLPADPTMVPDDIERLALAVESAVGTMLTAAQAASMPPSVLVSGSVQQLPNNTATSLVYDTVVFDNAGYAQPTVSNTSLILTPGVLHLVFAHVLFDVGGTGTRRMMLVDGTGTSTTIRAQRAMVLATEGASLFASTLVVPAANPAMTIQALQTNGTSFAVTQWQFGAILIG